MNLATLVVPLWARWLMLIAFAAALVGWGELRGYLREEHKFDAYQAEVNAIGKLAAERAQARKVEQDKNTLEVAYGFNQDVAAIHAYYARRVRDAQATARLGAVSAAPDGAVRTDGAAGQHDPAGSCDDHDEQNLALMKLEENCVLDASKVLRLQEFLRKNGFPVERQYIQWPVGKP